MITLQNIRLQYGERYIFRDETATIGPKARIGLVGSNGSGKTTLMRVLAGHEDLDGGSVDKARHATIGYLPQDGLHAHGKTLYQEAESVFSEVADLNRLVEEATEELQSLDTQSDDYAELLERIGSWERLLEDSEASKLPSRIKSVLAGLGFSESDFDRPTEEFSGGWQMRIALAKLLLDNPSLLLLDEPTNHLDLTSQRWLENYLQRYEGSILLVSHDRAFLDAICSQIFELSRGSLTKYPGGYSNYEKISAQQKEQRLRAQANQQKELKKTQEFIDRFRYKASKARQVQSRIKALDRVDLIEVEQDESSIAFSFPPAPRSGQTVLELDGLSKSYGRLTVLRDIGLRIERGDRIAVVGVNGAGKSTLVKVVAGAEPYQQGERKLGSNVILSYFAQHQTEELDPDSDPLTTMQDAAPSHHGLNLRSVLGSFLFRGDDVFKKVRVLSGGERNRLALAKILVQPSNFLILDEPTNHLDMQSQAVLQQALRDYGGSFLIVSHNRAFVDLIVNKTLEVRKDGISLFPGNVSDYLLHVERLQEEAGSNGQAAPVAAGQPAPEAESPKQRRRRRAELQDRLKPLKRESERLESQIHQLEARQETLEAKLADPDFFKTEQAKPTVLEYEKNKERLETAYERWGELTEQVATIEADL